MRPNVESTVAEPAVAAAGNTASDRSVLSSLPVVLQHEATMHDLTIAKLQPEFDVTFRSMSFNVLSTTSNVSRLLDTQESSSMAFLNRIDQLFSTDNADLLPSQLNAIDSPQTADLDAHFSELDWVAGP